jgi:hypothetical protein
MGRRIERDCRHFSFLLQRSIISILGAFVSTCCSSFGVLLSHCFLGEAEGEAEHRISLVILLLSGHCIAATE